MCLNVIKVIQSTVPKYMHCRRTKQADEQIKCWFFIDTTSFSHDSRATNSVAQRTPKSFLSKSKQRLPINHPYKY